MSGAAGALLREQVDEGEDGHPDDVDEVPVEAGDLQAHEVPRVEAPPQGAAEAGEEPDDADEDVRPVEAGEGEEGLPEDATGEGEPLLGELGELVGLAGEEA